MIDIVGELNAIHRQTGRGRLSTGEARTVVLRRTYDAAVEEVWDAITDPERIPRWFLPVSGDLRPGGTYQLQGNAGGRILACEPPTRLRLTWVFGEADPDSSEVEVQLAAAGDGTELVLRHTAVVDEAMWERFGPGATGVGWDLGLLGLGMYLRTGATVEDPGNWPLSAEGRQFATGSSQAWGAALKASGASDAQVASAVENTTKFYAPDPE